MERRKQDNVQAEECQSAASQSFSGVPEWERRNRDSVRR